jgi:hypothetical protein
LELLQHQRGESDLAYRRGVFYLAATCDVTESATAEPSDVLGVDLGVANIASDSDGLRYSGSAVTQRAAPSSQAARQAAKETDPRG